jgi:hypothetical protein
MSVIYQLTILIIGNKYYILFVLYLTLLRLQFILFARIHKHIGQYDQGDMRFAASLSGRDIVTVSCREILYSFMSRRLSYSARTMRSLISRLGIWQSIVCRSSTRMSLDFWFPKPLLRSKGC